MMTIDIEDRIIERLRQELTYLRTVRTYAGQLGDDIERLPVSFPAAYVVYGGSTLRPVDGPNLEERVEFSIIVAARDPRGRASALREEPGAYRMVRDVLEALTNSTLGLQIERLCPERVSLLSISGTTVIYAVDFSTGFDRTFQY